MPVQQTAAVNPYDEILELASHAAAIDIRARYEGHRVRRNYAQRQRLLSGELKSLEIDPVLEKLTHPSLYPDFQDERHCLVFWARPPRAVRLLIKGVQERLLRHAHNLCPMPPECLHMTVMEIAHSLTSTEMDKLVEIVRPKLETITDYTYEHRARLIKPSLSYDASAVALSFLPAAFEGKTDHDDSYSYHHLRRDVWSLCQSTGVKVASRYVLPSAHLTLGRFITNEDHASPGQAGLDTKKMEAWLKNIDDINTWLMDNYWPREDGTIAEGGEWIVGQEKGLSCQAGTIWYGSPDEGTHSGPTLRVGKGF